MAGAEVSPVDKFIAGDDEAHTVVFKWPIDRFTAVTKSQDPTGVNNWHTCDLWLTNERHEVFGVGVSDDSGRVGFSFRNGRQWNGVGEPVTLSIDGNNYEWDMSRSFDQLFFNFDLLPTDEFAVSLRTGHNLRVTVPGSAPADFSLTGAAEAIKVLDRCHDSIVAQAKARAAAAAVAPAQPSSGGSEISLQQQGGMLVAPVTINGAITLNFMIDSGASDVSVTPDVALTLYRTGTIRDTDFLGSHNFQLADGSTVPSPTFRIQSLKVGGREAHDVVANISSDINAPLLLGQSFLRKFTTWSVDNGRQVLVLGSDAT